jgi:hypothetical protein
MLQWMSKQGTRHCDGIARRELLRAGGIALGGLTLPQLLRLEQARAAGVAAPRRKARSVIMLFLSGGPAHQDMWDLKPEAPEEVRGTFRPIDTNVPGIQISEHMPRMARQADKYAILRAVHHPQSGHPAAAYWMMVGHAIQRPPAAAAYMSREDRPHPGSALHKVLGAVPTLPSFVMIPEAMQPNGPERAGQHAGFLGAAYDPYRVNSDPNLPDYSAGALEPQSDVPSPRIGLRRDLLAAIRVQSGYLESSPAGTDFGSYHDAALELVSSRAAREAFDVSRESAATRDRYGRHVFGQSVLVARRLVEAGVRLVHVNWVRHDGGKGGQGYDSHDDHLNWAKTELLPPTDAAFASLVEDLDERGLLDETLIVVMGEFGRTPKFNSNAGRDHWPYCFSVVMAGGGIRGGQVYGASDRIAAYPAANPVTPEEITATLYTCLGVDPHTLVYDRQNRPYHLAEGQAISAVV